MSKYDEDINESIDEFERLCEFMSLYANKKGSNLPYNYTTIDFPYLSCNIPDDMINDFFDLYADTIMAGKSVTITEKHKEFGPIVLDLDFIQSKENNQRYYTLKTIKNCIRIYNSIIRKYLNVSDKDMVAYVLEKDSPSLRKGEYHDGIHIIYPNICTRPDLQLCMRKDFIKQLEENNVFGNIPLINSLDRVVDEHVIHRVGWLLYGSKKSHSVKGYQLTHIYEQTITNNIGDIFDFDFSKPDKETIKYLVRNLSVRKFNSTNDLTPTINIIEPGINQIVSEPDINQTVSKPGINQTVSEPDINQIVSNNIVFIKDTPNQELTKAKKLVKLFSKERATNYYQWMEVGWCLHNINYELLEDWIKFSKKCPSKFEKSRCEFLWKKMKPSNYTIASLHYFAQIDNPKKYMEMYKK